MKTTRLVLVVLFVSSLWIMGCAKKTPKTPQVSSTSKPKIALVMKSLANEFFKTMEEGANAHQQTNAAQYELIVVGIRNEEDVSQQINFVESMIARKVQAIVIAPADSKSLVPVCKKAMDAGIVVVNIDNKLDAGVLAASNLKIPFVGPDNRKGARIAGEYLAAKLKPADKVAIIEGVPSAFNGIQRRLGFEDAMNAAKMTIVSTQAGNWETQKAHQVVSGILTSHTDLRAVLCANDSMALGAVAAIKAANKSDQILVVGFDNIEAAKMLLKEGKLLCTVDQHGDQLAVFGIEYALEILTKKNTPADKETPVDLITVESLK
ncbi:MAG: sugar ABC transporter substrate-binding protein [Phycisphaerae bacterium]|nr:sugar ABC transporter substrate-binding protein [Phycisphaerae bacterium]